jgi:hypothetical protein
MLVGIFLSEKRVLKCSNGARIGKPACVSRSGASAYGAMQLANPGRRHNYV